MNLKRNAFFLAVFSCQSIFASAYVAISSFPKDDLELLNKAQVQELYRVRGEIDRETISSYLENRKDSLETSLKTHAMTYKEGQKAYKRLVVWYIKQRLRALSTS